MFGVFEKYWRETFQPFLRFYSRCSRNRSGPRGFMFQPFLRFYFGFFARRGGDVGIITFQPFLRFYRRFSSHNWMHYEEWQLFQPFLRFYPHKLPT